MSNKTNILKLSVTFLVMLFIISCAVNPVTKKRELMLLSETQEIINFWQRYVMDKVFDSPHGWECQNMLTACLLMAQSAYQRQESRGVHFRKDFPQTDDKNYKKHIEVVR